MDVKAINKEELGFDGSGSKTVTAAPPRKIKIILKGSKKAVSSSQVVPAAAPPTLSSSQVPAAAPTTLSESSEEMKLETTKRKLERMYDEEAEKKAKKKIQRVDFPADPKNHGGNKAVKAVGGGDVRERLLAKIKRMKRKNEKPKYSLYSCKIL